MEDDKQIKKPQGDWVDESDTGQEDFLPQDSELLNDDC